MKINFLTNILSVPNPSGNEDFLADSIQAWCKTAGVKCSKDGKGNLYLVKGTPANGQYYVGATAHIDSVHRDQTDLAKNRKRMTPKVDGDKITMWIDDKQTGTGSDDKNAVAIILSLVTKVPAIKVAFYVGEEIGMQGVKASDMSFWDDVSWIFGCDSPGPSNRATKSCSGTQIYSDEFFTQYLQPICKKHGVTDFRSEPWTDVLTLVREGPKICCCNINNGGYEAHTSREWASYKDTCKTEELGLELMTSIPLDKRYVFEPKEDRPQFDWSKYVSSGAKHKSSLKVSQDEFDFGDDEDNDFPIEHEETDLCSLDLYFNDDEQVDEFLEGLDEKEIIVDISDVRDLGVNIHGELQNVKLAYVWYYDLVYDEKYTSWSEFEENEFTEDFFDYVEFDEDWLQAADMDQGLSGNQDEGFWDFIKRRKEENKK